MGNAIRGIVTADIGGETFTCRLGINEWCELEDELGKPMERIQNDILVSANEGNTSLKPLRSVFCAALRSHHPGVDLQRAGELMTELGMLQAVELIGKIIIASMPEHKEVAGDPQPGKPKRPPRK